MMVPGMVLCFLAFGEDAFVSEGLCTRVLFPCLISQH